MSTPCPDFLNASDLAEFFGTTRPSAYRIIELGALTPDKKKRYNVFDFVVQVWKQDVRFIDSENKSPGAALVRYYKADVEKLRCRVELVEAGLVEWTARDSDDFARIKGEL